MSLKVTTAPSKEDQDSGRPKPKKRKRARTELEQRKRLLEIMRLRAKGWTQEDIATELRVNRRTIIRAFQSPFAQEFVNELIQRQLFDIEHSTGEDYRNRLKYRNLLIGALLPRKIESSVEGGTSFEIVITDTLDAQQKEAADGEPDQG